MLFILNTSYFNQNYKKALKRHRGKTKTLNLHQKKNYEKQHPYYCTYLVF